MGVGGVGGRWTVLFLYCRSVWMQPSCPFEGSGNCNGVPMSVVVTNLVMEDIEERALSTFHPPYTTTRCMLKSWRIQRNENRLNREWGNLPEVYTALLD